MTHLTVSPERRRALQLLGVTAFSWALASRYAHAQNAPVQGPELLRIGYQKSAVNLVILKQQGVLEKRFPGTRISWLEFPAGPQLLEALSVGSLEFGLTGDSPPVFAQAAGKDLLYVGAEPPKPDSSALLVLKDSPLRTLSDLKGRRIAVQKGSSAHYLLVKAVERAGLQWADIQPVYLTPADARAAFERKSVDAWAIWDPFYAATELAIQPRVLATGRDLASSNNSFYLAARPLVQAGAHGHQKLEVARDGQQAGRHHPGVFARTAGGNEHALIAQAVCCHGHLLEVVVVELAGAFGCAKVAAVAVGGDEPENFHEDL